jgi:protein FAM32A
MGDYDFKPSGSLKLKGVKDKKIKKSKKEKPKKDSVVAKLSPAPEDAPTTEKYVVVQTEAEKRFEEIQRQRVCNHLPPPPFPLYFRWKREGLLLVGFADGVDGQED